MLVFCDTETTDLDERAGHLLEVAVVVTDDDLTELSHFSTVVRPVGINIDQVPMADVAREMHEKNGLFAELRAGAGMRRHEAEEALISYLTQPCTACDGDGWARSAEERDGCPNDCRGKAGKLAGNVELDVCTNCKQKRVEHQAIQLVRTTPGEGARGAGYTFRCGGDPIAFYNAKTVTLASQTPFAGSTIGFDRRWLRHHMPKLEALFSYRSCDVSSITELAKRWAPSVYEGRPKVVEVAHRALADVRASIETLRYYRRAGFVGGGTA